MSGKIEKSKDQKKEKDIKTGLKRLLKYGDRIFSLRALLGDIKDSRPKKQIPTKVITSSLFLLFTLRLRSLNELEQHKNLPPLKRFLGHHLPCADEFGYVTSKIDLASVRKQLGKIYSRLSRNKVLELLKGWRVAAVDGHEIGSSFDRCCPECLEREIEVAGKKRIQFYHRVVALILVGEKFRFLMDVELVKKGEDEIAAALRLLERVLQKFPRSFDVLTGDALYARPSVFTLLKKFKKYAVMVLKNENRDLIKDVRQLSEMTLPTEMKSENKIFTVWDIEHLNTWPQVGESVRVVRSFEKTHKRKRTAKQWVHHTIENDWMWVTNLPKSIASSEKIVTFGHFRWQIENQGFNELSTEWNANHYFHHNPVSIIVYWLMMFFSHAIFHCFLLRNLKPDVKKFHTIIFFAFDLTADFKKIDWWDKRSASP